MALRTGSALVPHVAELRRRLLRSLGLLLAGTITLFQTQTHWLPFFTAPLTSIPNAHLQFTTVTGPFVSLLHLSFLLSLVFLMPWFVYEVWAFVAPGLRRSERRKSSLTLLAIPTLFYVGLATAFFTVLPAALHFLLVSPLPGLVIAPTLESYITFTGMLCLAFGITFNLPALLFALIRTGVVKPAAVRQSRRFVVVGIFALAAVITPPDPLSMLLLAIPLWLMFEATLLLAKPR
ncbi:MAG TPA: twin-arginine translocase subunit TatC [Alphaproteobacteria bacterium]|nr:twin-arginine translocase subunit TatC [Alphaproteobacteria bacterium]